MIKPSISPLNYRPRCALVVLFAVTVVVGCVWKARADETADLDLIRGEVLDSSLHIFLGEMGTWNLHADGVPEQAGWTIRYSEYSLNPDDCMWKVVEDQPNTTPHVYRAVIGPTAPSPDSLESQVVGILQPPPGTGSGPPIRLDFTANLATPQPVIESIAWQGVNPNDGNSSQGTTNLEEHDGGYRLFAERNQPQGRGGDAVHDKVRIRVTLKEPPPEGEEVTVYFKIFDPDHWSDEDIGGSKFDPNDQTAPNDNVTAGGAVLMKADFSAAASSVKLVGDGEKRTVYIGMRIQDGSRQPTNNYLVAADLDINRLNDIVFGPDGTILHHDDPEDTPVPEDVRVTKLLTLWRTVYIEADSMGAPNLTQNPYPTRVAAGNGFEHPTNAEWFVTDLDVPTLVGEPEDLGVQYSQYQGGEVTFLRENDTVIHRRLIEHSGRINGKLVLEFANAVADAAAKFRNLDDDDIDPETVDDNDHDTGETHIEANDMQINFGGLLGFMQERYTPACIKINATKTDLSPTNSNNVNQNNVGFQTYIWKARHMVDNNTHFNSGQNFVAANKQSRCTADFWAIYMCGAFQMSPFHDNDPNGNVEEALSGYTYAPGVDGSPPADDAHSGILIFFEAMRDVDTFGGTQLTIGGDDLIIGTITHETGHTWGLTHDAPAGSIMHPGTLRYADEESEMKSLKFSGGELQTIIKSIGPGTPE